MKKLITTLGVMSAVVPLVMTVSCGSDKTVSKTTPKEGKTDPKTPTVTYPKNDDGWVRYEVNQPFETVNLMIAFLDEKNGSQPKYFNKYMELTRTLKMKDVATFGPNFGITGDRFGEYNWEGVDISNCKNISEVNINHKGEESEIHNAIWDKNVSKVKDENGEWTQEIKWEYVNRHPVVHWNDGKEYLYFTAKRNDELVLFNEDTHKWEEYKGEGNDGEREGNYAYELNKYVISKLEGYHGIEMLIPNRDDCLTIDAIKFWNYAQEETIPRTTDK